MPLSNLENKAKEHQSLKRALFEALGTVKCRNITDDVYQKRFYVKFLIKFHAVKFYVLCVQCLDCFFFLNLHDLISKLYSQ